MNEFPHSCPRCGGGGFQTCGDSFECLNCGALVEDEGSYSYSLDDDSDHRDADDDWRDRR